MCPAEVRRTVRGENQARAILTDALSGIPRHFLDGLAGRSDLRWS